MTTRATYWGDDEVEPKIRTIQRSSPSPPFNELNRHIDNRFTQVDAALAVDRSNHHDAVARRAQTHLQVQVACGRERKHELLQHLDVVPLTFDQRGRIRQRRSELARAHDELFGVTEVAHGHVRQQLQDLVPGFVSSRRTKIYAHSANVGTAVQDSALQ